MYIVFDIGGTNMRLASSKDGKKIDKIKIVPTPHDFKKGVAVFVELAKELTGKDKINGVAGGVPGTIDRGKNRLNVLPNLPKWSGKYLQKELEKSLNTKVVIENDAAVVGLGEAVFGVEKGEYIVAYITISTGIGGARIVNGKIDQSVMGFEPGHQIINFNNSGVVSDWESCVSGKSLERQYHKKPIDIKNKKIWQEVNKEIAYGLNNVIVFWSPDVVVLGGGIIKNNNVSISQIRKYLSDILKIYPKIPLIKKAKLKDLGGLYGAMCLLKKR